MCSVSNTSLISSCKTLEQPCLQERTSSQALSWPPAMRLKLDIAIMTSGGCPRAGGATRASSWNRLDSDARTCRRGLGSGLGAVCLSRRSDGTKKTCMLPTFQSWIMSGAAWERVEHFGAQGAQAAPASMFSDPVRNKATLPFNPGVQDMT